jgi:hypothetical protein
VDLVNLAANIPVSTEVERALYTSFLVMRSAQNSRLILKSHKDVAAMRSERNRNHIRAKTDNRFRTELVSDVLQYVSSALQSAALVGALSGADKQRGTVATRFHANLVLWVQTHFLPFVRERLPNCMLSPLLTAACDWGGQLQTTEPLLDAAAAASETGVGASMLSAARQQQRSVPAIGDGHQRSVPIARRLAFGEFQHLHNRCETCAMECKSARSRFVCSCGAICCKACYGLKGHDANEVAGYQCDACREEHTGAAVVHPREDFYFCHACTAELPPLSAIQALCPDCRCRFCQSCAAVAEIELRKPAKSVVGKGSGLVVLKCPTCVGSEKYEEGREAVCSLLLTRILGHRRTQPAKLTPLQLKSSKTAADELGDLLYDLFYTGYRGVFAKFLSSFLELVVAQLGCSIGPSVDPFHLLYYMGQDSMATSYLLARVCHAQAEESLRHSKDLLPNGVDLKASPASSESLPEVRPGVLRIGLFASDLVMNSPTADLACPVLDYFCRGPDSERFLFFLFADGPCDRSHPSAQHIARLFEDRLVLFTAETSAKTKYASIVEKELHALVTLTGWTHGHIAEVIAAVGSGPSPLVVFNWLGWAGLMFMRKAVHFTIVGAHALSPRQKLEYEQFRERVAVVSCYQPAQGRWSHPQPDRKWTRAVFNLPAAVKHFIFFFAGSINRILEETLFMWLDILCRVDG